MSQHAPRILTRLRLLTFGAAAAGIAAAAILWAGGLHEPAVTNAGGPPPPPAPSGAPLPPGDEAPQAREASVAAAAGGADSSPPTPVEAIPERRITTPLKSKGEEWAPAGDVRAIGEADAPAARASIEPPAPGLVEVLRQRPEPAVTAAVEGASLEAANPSPPAEAEAPPTPPGPRVFSRPVLVRAAPLDAPNGDDADAGTASHAGHGLGATHEADGGPLAAGPAPEPNPTAATLPAGPPPAALPDAGPRPPAEADPVPDAEPEAVPAPPAEADPVVSWHMVGRTGGPAERMQVSSAYFPDSGWNSFIRFNIQPLLDGGVRRFMIHNPFGTRQGEVMEFDQFLHAREAGLRHLTEGFVEAWRPIVRGDRTQGEPVEVIAYLGAMIADPEFEAIKAEGGEAAHARFIERADASIRPALEAGMTIGFDSSGYLPEDSWEFRYIQGIRDRGVRVYIEARPKKHLTHLLGLPVISTNIWWETSDPEGESPAQFRHLAKNGDVTGEHVIIVADPRPAAAHRARIGHYLAEGETVVVPFHRLHDSFQSREAVLGLGEPGAGTSYD